MKAMSNPETQDLINQLFKESLYDVLMDRELTERLKEFGYYYLSTEGG